MNRQKQKRVQRVRRHQRLRNRVHGTAERPRLAVYRSMKHIYAQIINDDEGRTLVAIATTSKDLKPSMKTGGDMKAAVAVGTKIAQVAVAAGIKKVAFDRGGNRYHGRIKALADAARKGGLDF
jgi:large subunit ribosomal protein L18